MLLGLPRPPAQRMLLITERYSCTRHVPGSKHVDDDGPAQAPEARPRQDRLREALFRRRFGAGSDRAGTGAPDGRGAHRPAPAAAEGDPQGRRAAVAVSVGRRILLDTNVFIDYLRLGSRADWAPALEIFDRTRRVCR